MSIWLGLAGFGTRRTVFMCDHEPTTESHGLEFDAVIGPFETLRGAEFMCYHGRGNPHCYTVADAERLSSAIKEPT